MQIQFGQNEVEFPSPLLADDLRDSSSLLADGEAMRRRLSEDGYLLIRRLHEPEAVLKARRAVVHFLGDAVAASADLMDAVIQPDCKPPRLLGNRDITHHDDVLAVLEGRRVFELFETLFGEPSRSLDYKWLRAVGQGGFTGSHYDVVYMGDGSQRLHTIWTPLGRVTPELGSLAICVGSHRLPEFEQLRQTYGRSDADRDQYGGWFTKDPQEITERFGGQWATTTFEPGDVIVFGMMTLHASTNNTTHLWRISCDTRFQPVSDPIDPRWEGDMPSGKQQQYDQLTPTPQLRSSWGL